MGGRGSGAVGVFLGSDGENGNGLLPPILSLSQVVVDEWDPFGGLAPERARLEKPFLLLDCSAIGASQ